MSTHGQGVRIFGILLGQSSQMGQSRINEPSFPTNPLELCVGQRRIPPRAPYNVEAGSSRGQRTQPIDSESGENWQFDLNEPFLRDNSGPEDGPSHSLMHCSQRDIRLPVSRFDTSVAQTSPLARGPVEPSLRPLQSPASRPSNPTAAQVPLVGQSLQSHGPTEVVDLVSEHKDEEEDAEDDDGDEEEEYDEDDEEEDDGGDAAASGYDDVIVSSPIASGQVIRTRYRALRMRASNDPGLVGELAAARNQRRRVNSDPQPSNSHVQRLLEAIEPRTGTLLDPKIDRLAIVYLYQAMLEVLVKQVSHLSTTKEIWDALKTRFVGVDRVQEVRIESLQHEVDVLKMKETDTIDDFSTNVSQLASKASNLGEPFEEKTLVRKLLKSISRKRYIAIVAIIEQLADIKTLTLHAVGRLKAFEE